MPASAFRLARKAASAVVLVASAAIALAAPASAQLIVRHSLPVETAKTMANAAQQKCTELGYSVSVHVVDAAGDTLTVVAAVSGG